MCIAADVLGDNMNVEFMFLSTSSPNLEGNGATCESNSTKAASSQYHVFGVQKSLPRQL